MKTKITLFEEILKFIDNPNTDTMSADEVKHELYKIIHKYNRNKIVALELF